VLRGTFVLALLMLGSHMLGWLDPMALQVRGAFDLNAAVMTLIAVAIVAGIARARSLRGALFRTPMLVLVGLWLLGVLGPTLRGETTLWLALNASKEFMMILAYFAAALFLRTERDVRWAWLFMLGAGLYYCVLSLLAQVFGPALLSKLHFDFRQDALNLWKVYVAFWPLVLIAFLFGVFRYAQGQRAQIVLVLLGAAGLLLTFFRSYSLATLVIMPAMLLLARARANSARAELGVAIGIFVLVAAVVAGSAWHGVADQFLLSGIDELRDQSGGSLAGRRAHTTLLTILAADRPLLGYGFLDRDSGAIQALGLPSFAGSVLGFVDAGWADVLVKFGYGGGIALYAAFVWIAVRALRAARVARRAETAARGLVACALIGIFCIVQPVHAPLTYSFGLLPLALLLGIMDVDLRLAARRPRAPCSMSKP
jgi:hypothetical protein